MNEISLQRVRDLSETTRDFRFVRNDGQPMIYEPGQFYRFVFEDAEGEFERSYSLCNFEPTDPATLDLVISKVEGGRATRLLFGDDLDGLGARITGPFGRLVLPSVTPQRLVMVATSVGLAPYMPILRQLETKPCPEVVLLLGVRDRSEFIYGEELLAYARENAWFQLRLCLSRESAAADYEYDGYVTTQVMALSPDKERDHYLLCGNPNMIDDVWEQLKKLDFRPKRVVREKYVYAREKKAAATEMTEAQRRLLAEKMKQYS